MTCVFLAEGFGAVHGALPAPSTIIGVPHGELTAAALVHVHPAVHHVDALGEGHVHESVVVLVHLHAVEIAVHEQQVGTVFPRGLCGMHVGLQPALVVAVNVDEEGRFIQGVQQTQVDLAGHGVRTVHCRARTLAQVDVLDPGAGDEREA